MFTVGKTGLLPEHTSSHGIDRLFPGCQRGWSPDISTWQTRKGIGHVRRGQPRRGGNICGARAGEPGEVTRRNPAPAAIQTRVDDLPGTRRARAEIGLATRPWERTWAGLSACCRTHHARCLLFPSSNPPAKSGRSGSSPSPAGLPRASGDSARHMPTPSSRNTLACWPPRVTGTPSKPSAQSWQKQERDP